MNNSIVIVGNGIAGITAIKAIRSIDKESEIHLFGEEKFYPYNRVRLSKGLLTSLEEDKILLQKKEWYLENNVRLHTDTKVAAIDTENKQVILENNDKLPYEKLLLANGAKNRKPNIKGIEKRGVMSLRTLEDALTILEEVKDMEYILQLGGGIQGLEMAWILSKLGKKVIIAEIFERIMPKNLDAYASEILVDAIRKNHIEVCLNTEITDIYGKDKVEGVKTKLGKNISCEGVIYSVGLQTNIDFIKNTDIKTNYGIVVDNRMQTNIEDVYAAGDVAEYDGKIFGLWNIAIAHGKTAGSNIVGKKEVYEHIVPVTTLNAFDLSLFSMGIIDEDKATNIILEKDIQEKNYNKILIRDNKVIGAIAIGNIRTTPVLKAAIEKEKDLSSIDFKNISVKDFIEKLKSIK